MYSTTSFNPRLHFFFMFDCPTNGLNPGDYMENIVGIIFVEVSASTDTKLNLAHQRKLFHMSIACETFYSDMGNLQFKASGKGRTFLKVH